MFFANYSSPSKATELVVVANNVLSAKFTRLPLSAFTTKPVTVTPPVLLIVQIIFCPTTFTAVISNSSKDVPPATPLPIKSCAVLPASVRFASGTTTVEAEAETHVGCSKVITGTVTLAIEKTRYQLQSVVL